MGTVLLTAFAPYDRWQENSSWLTLVELTKDLPDSPQVTTRRYPVDFAKMQQQLLADLEAEYDYVLHLGQAPGSGLLRLESVGVNVAGRTDQLPEEFRPIIAGGPVAYQSRLPLAAWSGKLRGSGIPCRVSYHAGTYLCNAALYCTHYFAEQRNLKTQAAFIHVPLAPSQVLHEQQDLATMPSTTAAQGVRLILNELNGSVGEI